MLSTLFSWPGREQDDCTHNVARPPVYLFSTVCMVCFLYPGGDQMSPQRQNCQIFLPKKQQHWFPRLRLALD